MFELFAHNIFRLFNCIQTFCLKEIDKICFDFASNMKAINIFDIQNLIYLEFIFVRKNVIKFSRLLILKNINFYKGTIVYYI